MFFPGPNNRVKHPVLRQLQFEKDDFFNVKTKSNYFKSCMYIYFLRF